MKIDIGKNTVAVRSSKHGYFMGRRATSKNPDSTHVQRLIRSTDLNHNGRIDKDERGGMILGRTTSVRASSRNRGYIRTLR